MTAEPIRPSAGAGEPDFVGVTLLDTYVVERKLAEGGMGSIYLARDVSLDRPVVVKVPHARFLGEPGFAERFAREIAGLVQLEHPHVVRILARGERQGVPFLVLQYLGGGSLEDRIARLPGGRLAPLEVAVWLRPLAETLDAVHARGFLHRDVKPGNVLFDEAGHVFLSDFGVAKALRSEDPAVTQPGSGIGSPRYMAPEQALGSPVTPAADQYALAACVYQTLAGVPPFDGRQAVEVMVRKTKEEAPPLAAHAPGVPEGAAEAVMRALARDPAARFPSCTGFADAFCRGLGLTPVGAAVLTGPAPTTAGCPARTHRPRARLGLAGLLALGLGAGLLALLSRPPAAPSAPPGQAEAPSPARSGPEVVLTDPGAGERWLLRYHVAAGARDRVRLEVGVVSRFLAGPAVAPLEEDRVAFDGELYIEDVDPETGLIQYTFRIPGLEPETATATRVPDWPGIDRAALARLEGLTARGLADDRGRTRRVAFEVPGDLPPAAQAALDGLTVTLRDAFTPLPAEPVGVDARWQVSEVGEQDGIWMTQGTEYRLTAKEGWRLTLRTQGAAVAPAPAVASAAVAGIEARVKGITMSMSGEIVQDLYELAPRSVRTEGTATVSTALTSAEGKEGVPITVEMRHASSLTRVEKDG